MTTVAQGAQQTINLAAAEAVQVSTAGLAYVDLVAGAPGSPHVSRRVDAGVPQQFGPYGVAATLVVRAIHREATSDVATPAGMTTSQAFQLRAVVSAARNVGGMSPYLNKRKQSLLECWAGKVKSVSNGSDYTTRVFRTLECHTERIRVGIINCVAADLVNVRVSVGTADRMPADLASLHGSTTTDGAILSNGTLTNGSAFTVAAGTDVNKPKITWSAWLDTRTIDRVDVAGGLPAVRISIEIPAAGNANRPAYDTSDSRAGWEPKGDAATAPYGRCYKARDGAGLGVTTPSAGSSTTYSDQTIPFVLEYVPRDGALPVSLTNYGDSISEGSGATISGHGWLYEARARLSTMTAPIGVCCMAAAGTQHGEYADRVEAVAADLASDVAILQMFTPNGITAPNFTAVSGAPTQRRANQRARAALQAQGALVVGFSGIPMEAAFKNLDAASAAVLNAYMAGVRNGSLPMIDGWGAMVGSADADGQFACASGTLADGVHPNSVGHRDRIAPELVKIMRALMLAPTT
ncbi:MAG: SGNH/GDSL hydrolase family protein [Burkholderiaceae bacterium]|nr:SGNH/GDSL hydrolase family protein [Burkholderiaceae bacterium]